MFQALVQDFAPLTWGIALHTRGPYRLHDLILGLGVHMVVIGLPISFSVRRFAK